MVPPPATLNARGISAAICAVYRAGRSDTEGQHHARPSIFDAPLTQAERSRRARAKVRQAREAASHAKFRFGPGKETGSTYRTFEKIHVLRHFLWFVARPGKMNEQASHLGGRLGGVH